MSPIERRTIAGVVSSLIIDVIRREKIMSDKDFEAKWPLLVYRSSSLLDEIKHSFRLIVFTKALLEAERENELPLSTFPKVLGPPGGITCYCYLFIHARAAGAWPVQALFGPHFKDTRWETLAINFSPSWQVLRRGSKESSRRSLLENVLENVNLSSFPLLRAVAERPWYCPFAPVDFVNKRWEINRINFVGLRWRQKRTS